MRGWATGAGAGGAVTTGVDTGETGGATGVADTSATTGADCLGDWVVADAEEEGDDLPGLGAVDEGTEVDD